MTRALAQLDDPAIARVLLQSLALSAVAFAALFFGGVYGLHAALAGHGGWAWLAGIAGGAGAVVLALFLFLPLAVLIATLFIDPVAAAVERRFYAGLETPRGAALPVQAWDGIVLSLQVLALELVALVVALLLPGPGFVLGWLINAWALGRGFFVAVAMRRMSREKAVTLYGQRRGLVLIQGGVLAGIGSLPLLNLLVPVLATAAMTHVLHAGDAPPQMRTTTSGGGEKSWG
jgi:CysZ protein